MRYDWGEIDRAISNEEIIVRVRSEGCSADFWRGGGNGGGASIGILGFVWTSAASGRAVKFSTFRSLASPPIRKFRGAKVVAPFPVFSNTTIGAPTRTMNPPATPSLLPVLRGADPACFPRKIEPLVRFTAEPAL